MTGITWGEIHVKVHCKAFAVLCTTTLLFGCAVPLSQRLTGHKFPVATTNVSGDVSQIEFSTDPKYETPRGVAFRGDPLICTRAGVFRVNDENAAPNRVTVNADEEIAVTSVIEWSNSGFTKVCGPFARFTPEKDAKYIVVNERIGGKGISALWTGMAFQTCMVSVYKENKTGFERVDTSSQTNELCRVIKR